MVGLVYKDGIMDNVNNFLLAGSGWSLFWAHDINDQSQIVGVPFDSQVVVFEPNQRARIPVVPVAVLLRQWLRIELFPVA
jgi:hypothetical protein